MAEYKNGSVHLIDPDLTAGRVIIAGTGGLLTDDSDLTFLTDTLTATKLAGDGSALTGAPGGGGITTGSSFPATPADGQMFVHEVTGRRILYQYVLIGTGTHTGANNAASLTDSAAVFTTSVLVGGTINNTTDGSSASITANTSTTVTGTLSGGTDNDWDTGDAYKAYGWIPKKSYGSLVVYVHSTGTDDLNHGTATGTDAFKTIQYAYDAIPSSYYTARINISAETFNESLTFSPKVSYADGANPIIFWGTMAVSKSGTVESSTAGSGATWATVTDNGEFGSYDNSVISIPTATNSFKTILSDTANVLSLVGALYGAEDLSDKAYEIQTWTGGTKITGTGNSVTYSVFGASASSGLYFRFIEFDTGLTADVISTGGIILFYGCKFNHCLAFEVSGIGQFYYCQFAATTYWYVNSSWVEFVVGNKANIDTNCPNDQWCWVYDNGSIRIDSGNYFNGTDTSTIGFLVNSGGNLMVDTTTETYYGYNKMDNWSTAVKTEYGGSAYWLTNVVFTGNTKNKDAQYSTLGTMSDAPEFNPFHGLKNEGGSLINIPTNAAWATTLTGSGALTADVIRMWVSTGATNSSTAIASTTLIMMNPGNSYTAPMDWNTDLVILDFNICRITDTASCVAKMGLYLTPKVGATDDKAAGIKIANLTMYSDTMGTVLDNTSLDTTMTANVVYHVTIISYPTALTRRVEWYVNDVLKLTDTTATHLPDSTGTAVSLALTIEKGAVADEDHVMVGNVSIWYRRY